MTQKEQKVLGEELSRAYEHGRLVGENEILKKILEQKLEIKLIHNILGDFE